MSFPVRNTAWSGVDAQMINSSTGANFAGTVTCYVNGDDTGQVLGSSSSGVCSSAGNGVYVYVPTAAETNYSKIAFTFVGSGAISVTKEYATITTAQQQAVAASTSQVSITTVAALLTMALKRINVVQAGAQASGEDLSDAFDLANLWLDSLQLERLSIPYIGRNTFPISTTKGTPTNPYTVGVSGDINIAKPIGIDRINFYDTASSTVPTEIPLIPLTNDAYQGTPQKTQTATYPIGWYLQPTYASAQSSLYLWPIPTSTTLIGVIYAPATIQQFTSPTQSLALPPGYKFFMEENLALHFAQTFRENIPPDPGLVASARATKENIKTTNVQPMDMAFDPAALINWQGRSNIYSDQT